MTFLLSEGLPRGISDMQRSKAHSPFLAMGLCACAIEWPELCVMHTPLLSCEGILNGFVSLLDALRNTGYKDLICSVRHVNIVTYHGSPKKSYDFSNRRWSHQRGC